jgi:xanthine dehydrogenase accessory factor
MPDLLEALYYLLAEGQDALLVSILAESGSAPRGAGAHMLVGKEGRLWGSIGGGAMEYQALQLAQQLLHERRSLQKEYHLSRDLGMICGGEATLFYQFVAAQSQVQQLCATALFQMELDMDLWLILRPGEGGDYQMGLYSREEGISFIDLDEEALEPYLKHEPTSFHKDGAVYYIEPICSEGRVMVFGGGHVAQALVPLLAKLGFDCCVLDDRPEYATTELFPEASKVICGDYGNIGEYIEIRTSDFVVVMTHGHASDYSVQKYAMLAAPAYIGVIGSRNKVKTISERLMKEGFSAAQLAQVHSPIGLPIMAETPREIAVSIAAQLIQVRAEGKK